MTARLPLQRSVTAAVAAQRLKVSPRWVRSLMAVPREEWLDLMAQQREQIRAFHDDLGHSWAETADHFGVSVDTARRRAYRARAQKQQAASSHREEDTGR